MNRQELPIAIATSESIAPKWLGALRLKLKRSEWRHLPRDVVMVYSHCTWRLSCMDSGE